MKRKIKVFMKMFLKYWVFSPKKKIIFQRKKICSGIYIEMYSTFCSIETVQRIIGYTLKAWPYWSNLLHKMNVSNGLRQEKYPNVRWFFNRKNHVRGKFSSSWMVESRFQIWNYLDKCRWGMFKIIDNKYPLRVCGFNRSHYF